MNPDGVLTIVPWWQRAGEVAFEIALWLIGLTIVGLLLWVLWKRIHNLRVNYLIDDVWRPKCGQLERELASAKTCTVLLETKVRDLELIGAQRERQAVERESMIRQLSTANVHLKGEKADLTELLEDIRRRYQAKESELAAATKKIDNLKGRRPNKR